MNRAALCCSGGGIRSATFCLGIIQALAAHDVGGSIPAPANATASPKPDNTPAEVKPPRKLLGCFQYLSTVSGGGYIGSWLSSWLNRNEFDKVIKDLTSRPSGPDVEPAEISWLRAYSNYLTPRLGIASADAWAAVAIFVRNLLLNWLIIIPVVCWAVLSLKLVATLSVWLAHNVADTPVMIAIVVIGAICLIVAQSFTNRHRPTRRAENANVEERTFLSARSDLGRRLRDLLHCFLLIAVFHLRLQRVDWSRRAMDSPCPYFELSRRRSQIEVSAADGDRRHAGLLGWLDCRASLRQRWPGFPCLGSVGTCLRSAGGSRRISVFVA